MARIMIIDDDHAVRDALGELVHAAGHDICTAAEGSQALDRLPSFRPDLVITDILMPGMEGMQTIYELRKRQPELPIIAMSGGSGFRDMDYLKTAERIGASHTLCKPVEPASLIAAIQGLLSTAARTLRV